jgi:hypothetical protein
MISESAVMVKIRKQRACYAKESPTPFVKGLIIGMNTAQYFIEEVAQEAKNIRDEYRGRTSRWSAAKFRHAIVASLNYLKRCDRARGIRILEAALEHEGVEKNGR